MTSPLTRSRALWNRHGFDLASDEILIQLLDRGSVEDWRELYLLASRDETLRGRIAKVLYRAPLGYPGFWLAALAALGHDVDWATRLPEDAGV